ncbi:unnamed protein product [Calicophoron daubneyi]|uniref:Band 7 domain-containing protein n=1 Tax=Calicophoron daubneyi TaxID=300641 RepID=A0AAV2T4N9_CALDB
MQPVGNTGHQVDERAHLQTYPSQSDDIHAIDVKHASATPARSEHSVLGTKQQQLHIGENEPNDSRVPASHTLSDRTLQPQRRTANDHHQVVSKSSPRVSFDEHSNTHRIYEDVVTLHVPSKENLWLSCRTGCARHFKWFRRWKQSQRRRKNRKSLRKPGEKSPRSNSQNLRIDGNHLQSIYDNEPDNLKSNTMRNTGSGNNHHHDNHNHNSYPRTGYELRECMDTDPNEDNATGTDRNSMVWTTNFLAALSILLIILTFPFSLIYCVRIVAEYERAVVLRMGNLIPKGKGTKGPGLFFILPCIDSVRKVDLRTITFAIPPQELLTRDSVTVSVDAVVYYRVLNPVASVLNIEDAARSTRLLAQTTIRNVLGTKDLGQILMDRDEISLAMQTSLDATTDAWGVKVERVEIKDVRLPVQLQRAMAAEAEAAREARAKIIAATGEQEAARSLKKAARVIATSPMAFQLRYLQTLCAISAEKNSTIIFPVPIDIMQNIRDLSNYSLGKFGSWSLNPQTLGDGAKCFQGTSTRKPQPIDSTKDQTEGQTSKSTSKLLSVKGDRKSSDDVFWSQEDADANSDTV